MNISVIIPSYRNPAYLDICLRSLTENKVFPETEIIVVLDGYSEESMDVVSKYTGVKFIELVDNKGFQYASNIGTMMASNEWVLHINDDNVVCKNFDERLFNELVQFPENELDRQVFTIEQVETTSGMFDFLVHNFGNVVETFEYEKWIDEEQSIPRNKSNLSSTGRTYPFLMKKKYYMAVGGLDTFYNSPNACDWDFFLRLQLLDFKFARINSLAFYHFGSVVTKKTAEATSFSIRQQQAAKEYEWKWGTPMYNEPHTNSKIPPTRTFRGFTV